MSKEDELIQEMAFVDLEISKLMATIADQVRVLKDRKDTAEKQFKELVSQKARTQLDNKPYKCGTTYIETDQYKIKAVVSKTVKWDEAELLKTEAQILEAGKNPKDFIKYKLSVGEREYDKFPDPIKEVFKKARTVTASAPTITYEMKE